ncbi:MAG: alpha/beta hydrolase [Myxococcota bacterium]
MAISLLHRLAPVSWYAARLERALEALVRAQPEIDVVCHSMGGIVLRMVLQRRPDLAEHVHTVVTLGSPHHGTAAARGMLLLPEPVALARGSWLLGDLPHLPALLPGRRVVGVAGEDDAIVYPVATTDEPGAEHVVLPHRGHMSLLVDPAVHEVVLRALSEPVGAAEGADVVA